MNRSDPLSKEEKYFRKTYNIDMSPGGLLHKVTYHLSYVPSAKRETKKSFKNIKIFENWLGCLQGIRQGLEKLQTQQSIADHVCNALIKINSATKEIKLIKRKYEETKRRLKIPQGHDHSSTNKWILQISAILHYKEGTHKGEVNWIDVQRLASYFIKLNPKYKELLESIVTQEPKSLKSKLFRTKKTQRMKAQYPPEAFQIKQS